MDYPDYLRARRPLIAHVIRVCFRLLATGERTARSTGASTASA
jgi:hypothetical protein